MVCLQGRSIDFQTVIYVQHAFIRQPEALFLPTPYSAACTSLQAFMYILPASHYEGAWTVKGDRSSNPLLQAKFYAEAGFKGSPASCYIATGGLSSCFLQGDKMTGKVKEGFGNVTGDDSKKAEGKA